MEPRHKRLKELYGDLRLTGRKAQTEIIALFTW